MGSTHSLDTLYEVILPPFQITALERKLFAALSVIDALLTAGDNRQGTNLGK